VKLASEPIKKCDVAIEKWEGIGICHGNGSTTHTYNTIIHSLVHSIHSQLAVSSALRFSSLFFGFSFSRVKQIPLSPEYGVAGGGRLRVPQGGRQGSPRSPCTHR